MKWLHCSKYPIYNIFNIKQSDSGKPSGLWFAQDDSWENFNSSSGFYYYKYALSINSSFIRIKKINVSSQEALQKFVKMYGYNDGSIRIKWSMVEKDFDGIIFFNTNQLPFQYYSQFNNESDSWILSLDVDSFCIWNAKYNVKLSRIGRRKHIVQ